MTEKYLGENIGKLGYGNMRLPKIDGEVDMKTVNEMIDAFIGNGYSYFDTAFIYEGSEEVLREALVKRHPREKFQIATKISLMKIKTADEMQYQVDTSMKRLGVDFVDFYLIHGLNEAYIKKADEYDAWSFIRGLKEKGIAKHIGFSFHGTPEELEYLLETHPYFEFVQLQINYLDWDSEKVQSREIYEIAREFNVPVIIMEPIKGGLLASDGSPVAPILKKYNPSASVASWALRYAATLDGVLTTLSGMSALEQLVDNVNTVNNLKPLSSEEIAVLAEAVKLLNSTPRIPCTGCEYCVKGCPKQIKIPSMMNLYSDYLVYNTTANIDHVYRLVTKGGTLASTCIECKKCEDICPQGIAITDTLKKLAELFDN